MKTKMKGASPANDYVLFLLIALILEILLILQKSTKKKIKIFKQKIFHKNEKIGEINSTRKFN